MPPNPKSQIDSPRAWLIVAAAFLGAFVSFGVTYTFGVFLRPMAEAFHVSHATMSIMFAVIAGLSFFLAPFTGELADRYGPRPVVGAGAVLMCIALILTSHVQSFPLVLITYGGGLGCAAACIYIPSISAVGEWFEARRDIALGISISGIGCGTLVAAPLSALLIDRYGWRAAFVIFGWASGALLLLSAALLSRPPFAGEKKKAAIGHKLRTPVFGLLYVSLLFAGVAVYVSFVFIPAFATDIGVSRVAGAAVIGYIGASSVVGRLGLNALAPRFGLMRMYQSRIFNPDVELCPLARGALLSSAGALRIGDGSGLWRNCSHGSSRRSYHIWHSRTGRTTGHLVYRLWTGLYRWAAAGGSHGRSHA